MKLLEVSLMNFRQYGGTNVVKMSDDPERNFTVIQGANGTGKSNLMCAILWCMYGDKVVNFASGEELLNDHAEKTLPEGETVKVTVSTKWWRQEGECKIERSCEYVKTNGKTKRSGQPSCVLYKIGDGKGWVKDPSPEWFIEKHLIPEELVGFFFFDGEKMDEYFKDTSKVKSNVEKISQIDVLSNAIQTIKSAAKTFSDDYNKYISPEEGELLDKLESNNEEREKLKQERTKLEERNKEIESRLGQIHEFLMGNSPKHIQTLEEERDDLNMRIRSVVKGMDDNDASKRDLIAQCLPVIFASRALKSARETIEYETECGVLPPDIKDTFLKELLDKGVCICGRELHEGSEQRAEVELMLQKAFSNDTVKDAVEGKFIIDNLSSRANFIHDYSKLLNGRKDLDRELKELNEKINKISSELGKSNVESVKALDEERTKLDREKSQNSVRIGTVGNKYAGLSELTKNLEEEVKNASHKTKEREKIYKVWEHAVKLGSLMEGIRDKIVSDVRLRLEDETSNYFFNMIWKKEAFSGVRIEDLGSQYKISLKNEYGKESLGRISAGERQVLALAFTAALYHVSGYSVPVIIDTPLGRISDEPSENIAESLPNYLSDTQVIMLVTDKEYSPAVRGKLLNHVGKEYLIKYDEKTMCSEVILLG